MRNAIYILTLAFGFCACNNSAKEKPIDNNIADSLHQAPGHQSWGISTSDNSRYDPAFLEELAGYNEPIKLLDNYIITGKDTTYFPAELPLNKTVIFKGAKRDRDFLLSVTRTNLTNLLYDFKLSDKNNRAVDNKSGKAVLGAMFFLASEMDEDSETGAGYGSSEYWDKSNNCWLSIRIGIGKDDNGKQRAMLQYGCEGKSGQALNLHECPTLRTESKSDNITGNALRFINAYVDNCNKMNKSVRAIDWVNSSPLATNNFKAELKRMEDEANRKDPELGIGADPVLDAQDWPDKGFELAAFDSTTNYLTVKGKNWAQFKVTIKMINENGSWLVDGCGMINIPNNRRAKR